MSVNWPRVWRRNYPHKLVMTCIIRSPCCCVTVWTSLEKNLRSRFLSWRDIQPLWPGGRAIFLQRYHIFPSACDQNDTNHYFETPTFQEYPLCGKSLQYTTEREKHVILKLIDMLVWYKSKEVWLVHMCRFRRQNLTDFLGWSTMKWHDCPLCLHVVYVYFTCKNLPIEKVHSGR